MTTSRVTATDIWGRTHTWTEIKREWFLVAGPSRADTFYGINSDTGQRECINRYFRDFDQEAWDDLRTDLHAVAPPEDTGDQ